MDFQGAIGFLVVGIGLIGALFCVVYGAMNDNAILSIGTGVLGTALGMVMRHYFPELKSKIQDRKGGKNGGR